MLSLAFAVHLSVQTVDYTDGFKQILTDIQQYGAFVQSDKIDFDKLEQTYLSKVKAAKTRNELVPIMEQFVAEFHDFHMSLNTNDSRSPRLVTSGADLYGIWNNKRAYIEQIRPGSPAKSSGLKAGDLILSTDGKPSRQAAQSKFGVQTPGKYGWEWALNAALAGTWDKERTLVIQRGQSQFSITLKPYPQIRKNERLTVQKLSRGIILLRPEDSLGDVNLVRDFDDQIPEMRKAKGVIIDLRNTASGGNSTVARGIIGLFITKKMPYQRHRVEEFDTNTIREWVEYASPRLKLPIKTKVCVLVDRWTGSMGEGIAIGFDATSSATVIGTKMAGLRGAVEGTEFSGAGFSLYFPTEQIFHINGMPRHQWTPKIFVKPELGQNPVTIALNILSK